MSRGSPHPRRWHARFRRRISLPGPRLILVMGVAGSGKTTLSKELSRRVATVYLDNNHIADAFFPQTRNGARYEKLRPCFYSALYKIAEENLKLGNSVLLDIPHVKEVQSRVWRVSIRRLAERANAEMLVVKCLCSESVLRRRLRARDEARDRWKLSHWEAFLAQQPIDVRVPFDHLTVNTENDLSANVEAAVQYLVNGRSCRH